MKVDECLLLAPVKPFFPWCQSAKCARKKILHNDLKRGKQNTIVRIFASPKIAYFIVPKNIFFHIFEKAKQCVFCTSQKNCQKGYFLSLQKMDFFFWILTHGEIPSWGCGGWVLCGGGNRSREGRGLTPRSRTLSLKNRRLTCTYQPNCICGMNSPNLGELSSPLFFFLEAIPPASYISGKLEFFPWHEMKFSLIIILQFFWKKKYFLMIQRNEQKK